VVRYLPPPSAIVSYWGFGDVDGDWTTKPSEAYRKRKLIEKEDAWAGVGGQVLTNTNQTNGRGRAVFFLYLKQTGQWLNAVSGFDPESDREKITPFCPNRNVSPKYPPTLFLHGTADKDVPVEQSIAMARALKRHGVAHELITIEGGGHSLWGGDRALIDQAFERSMEYIREYLSEQSLTPRFLRNQVSRNLIGDFRGLGILTVGKDRDRVSGGGVVRQIGAKAKDAAAVPDDLMIPKLLED